MIREKSRPPVALKGAGESKPGSQHRRGRSMFYLTLALAIFAIGTVLSACLGYLLVKRYPLLLSGLAKLVKP